MHAVRCGVAECPEPRVSAMDWCPAHGAAWEASEIEHYALSYERFRSHMRDLGTALEPRHVELFEGSLALHLERLFAYAEGAL